MLRGVIFDIKRYAIRDGPGIRTTVFLKGCPLACWWCHNPESQAVAPQVQVRRTLCVGCGTCVRVCPERALELRGGHAHLDYSRCTGCGDCVEPCPAAAIEIAGRRVSVDELTALIVRDVPFFDESGGGVTFSGGEPLAQPGFLLAMLKRCRELGIHRAVDTSGYAARETIAAVAGDVDLFLFDLKLMDSNAHAKFTGVGNGPILANLRTLCERGANVAVRIPVIPGITDTSGNIEEIGVFLATLPRPPEVTLLPHHPAATAKYARFDMEQKLPEGLRVPTIEELERLADRLRSKGLTVKY